MTDLEKQVRQALVRKSLKVFSELEQKISRLHLECKAQYLKTYGRKFTKQAAYQRISKKDYFFEKVQKMTALIYIASPLLWSIAYTKQRSEALTTEESDSAYQNLLQQTKDFAQKIGSIKKRIEENNVVQHLDAILYSNLHEEFKTQREYIQYLSDFYSRNYSMVGPTLDVANILVKSLLKARRLITAREAELIFKEAN